MVFPNVIPLYILPSEYLQGISPCTFQLDFLTDVSLFLNDSKESIHFIFGPPELHFIDHCLCQSICRGATVTPEVSVWVLWEPVRVWINCRCNLWEGNITPALFCSCSDKAGAGVWVFSRRICSLWKGVASLFAAPEGCFSLIPWELMTVHPPEEGRSLWKSLVLHFSSWEMQESGATG